MRQVAMTAVIVGAATLVGIGYLSRCMRRARREIGGEIQAATVVLSSASPPPNPRLRLVEDDERAMI